MIDKSKFPVRLCLLVLLIMFVLVACDNAANTSDAHRNSDTVTGIDDANNHLTPPVSEDIPDDPFADDEEPIAETPFVEEISFGEITADNWHEILMSEYGIDLTLTSDWTYKEAWIAPSNAIVFQCNCEDSEFHEKFLQFCESVYMITAVASDEEGNYLYDYDENWNKLHITFENIPVQFGEPHPEWYFNGLKYPTVVRMKDFYGPNHAVIYIEKAEYFDHSRRLPYASEVEN